MKNFACPVCSNKVYFENMRCMNCGHRLGFDDLSLTIVAMTPKPSGVDCRKTAKSGKPIVTRYCANEAQGVCNWLAVAGSPDGLCSGCKLNGTIPNLSETGGLDAWRQLERAKKRMLYSFRRFGLCFDGAAKGSVPLRFDFMRHSLTGYMNGVITIEIQEVDAVEREKLRQKFQEPYRTLLGHFRHESGHFFWPALVANRGRYEEFRKLFGDERADYGQALSHYHNGGLPADWQSRFVSTYASAHPWEDWAETWAHYLHMVSVLDTADAVGMDPRAAGIIFGAIWPFATRDVYRAESCEQLVERWIPLTIALNSLNRAIGQDRKSVV